METRKLKPTVISVERILHEVRAWPGSTREGLKAITRAYDPEDKRPKGVTLVWFRALTATPLTDEKRAATLDAVRAGLGPHGLKLVEEEGVLRVVEA